MQKIFNGSRYHTWAFFLYSTLLVFSDWIIIWFGQNSKWIVQVVWFWAVFQLKKTSGSSLCFEKTWPGHSHRSNQLTNKNPETIWGYVSAYGKYKLVSFNFDEIFLSTILYHSCWLYDSFKKQCIPNISLKKRTYLNSGVCLALIQCF